MWRYWEFWLSQLEDATGQRWCCKHPPVHGGSPATKDYLFKMCKVLRETSPGLGGSGGLFLGGILGNRQVQV